MLKKLFIISLYLIVAFGAYAQQWSVNDLKGRWTHNNNSIGDLVFFNNDTAAFASTTGLINAYVKYTCELKKGVFKFKYTLELNRKNPNYLTAEIKFINDSIFLFKADGSIPANADTTTKKLNIYKKVKSEKPGTQLYLPTYHDLLGAWTLIFKGEKDYHIIFKDVDHAEFIDAANTTELTYKSDFTKQPITIDFYYTGTSKKMQAFLRFAGENVFHIEEFPDNNRGDHMTMFGHNMLFVKK